MTCDPYGPAGLPSRVPPPLDRPVVLGEPGRLGAVPMQAVGSHIGPPVADTEIDWFDAPAWDVRAISVRGHGHRFEGSVRQDACGVREGAGLLLCAVADGVGSEPLSHLGSRWVASEATVEVFGEWLWLLEGATADFGWVADRLGRRASRHGAQPKEFSTTLTCAAISSDEHGAVAVIARIGDSDAWLLRQGGISRLTGETQRSAVASNSVSPLPGTRQAQLLRVPLVPGDVLLLATDGVSNLIEDVPEYRDNLVTAWQGHSPMPGPLLALVDAAVRSYDDDRTLVCIRINDQEGTGG